MKADFVMYML